MFDGEQPQQDLARMGGDAAILNIDLGRSGIPLTRRTEKSTDYYPEIVTPQLRIRVDVRITDGFTKAITGICNSSNIDKIPLLSK